MHQRARDRPSRAGRGVQLITIHGRTRNQFYKGRADWTAIREVVEATQLPVIANGDCASVEDARVMLDRSGAAGVMIGRAAVGRPWLVGQIADELAGRAPRDLTRQQMLGCAVEHLETLMANMGERSGLRHARKHLSAYAEHAGASEPLRLRLVTADDAREAISLLTEIFSRGPATEIAAEAA